MEESQPLSNPGDRLSVHQGLPTAESHVLPWQEFLNTLLKFMPLHSKGPKISHIVRFDHSLPQ